MVSVYQLKTKFQALLRPLVQKIFNAGFTANQVTIATCVGSFIVALIIVLGVNHHWIFALLPVWMFIRMALNAVDGMLAREFNQQSVLGAYLNELCDVIADSALLLVFAFVSTVNPLLLTVVIILSLLTEYAGVMGPLVGASRRYDGPMGKSDRALVIGIMAAAIAIDLLPVTWINTLLWIMATLLVYTLINRIVQGLKELSHQQKG
ncbi:CDP-alcohol phosphatidyltransferase family protein [Utexia brackfieldae]|uniref:CDP-alcohol phosphatidyltransferase family protein n=1 Tax=Utexia brackfieldae TaxID=3074108 RepID=UPI00370DDC50